MGYKTVPLTLVLVTIIIIIALAPNATLGEIRTTKIRSDSRSVIAFDEFGYTHLGTLNLTVSRISFSTKEPQLSLLGFFLSTRDSWYQVFQQLQDGDIQCPLNSDHIKPVYSFSQLQLGRYTIPNFNISLKVSDANQFTLLFANCIPDLMVSMDVHSVMYNSYPLLKSSSSSGSPQQLDFLSAGKTCLPLIYFLFSLVYLSLILSWVIVLFKNRLSTHGIHYFMLSVLILKAFNLLCEAEDKSYIKRTGSAHGWDILFYLFSFLKGVTLFTLIVLIGTGWSFLKPYLQDKEKKVLMVVIPLQVVANVAQVVIDETGPFDENSYTWKKVFLLVDIICCCAVLFPIVWSIKNLREAAKVDGKAAVNLMKLTLFRHYYIVIISYIYFTRVVVYALETITSYRFLWTAVVAGELATVAFYVFTGYNFRPKAHNPYFAIDDEEEEAAAEQLKLEDEFEL